MTSTSNLTAWQNRAQTSKYFKRKKKRKYKGRIEQKKGERKGGEREGEEGQGEIRTGGRKRWEEEERHEEK